MTHTVNIIGAGPGGLAAAMLLRQAGLHVRLIEQKPYVGGRCSAIKEQGYRFDLGPTFFLYPQVLERIFRIVGHDLFQEIEMVRLDPQYRVIFGGNRGQLDCTPNLQRMADEVGRLSPNDAANVKRFIDDNRIKLERFRPALESPFNNVRSLISWELLKLLPMLRPWLSVDSELKRYFSDERIRLAFSFQSKYLGMSPFNCPSLFSILSYLEYDFGVWHPIGGCSAISEKMADIATDMGVELRLDEPVEEILFENRKAVGVRTPHESYMADSLVINADFAHAMSHLVPDKLRRNWTDAKLEKKRYSCSTYMMYLGIEGYNEDVPHHTIYTSADYLGNLDDIETRNRLSNDPSIYVQNACVTDPGLAPDGHSTLYILAPVPHCNTGLEWPEQMQSFRKEVLGQLQQIGIDDIESRIRYERIITPKMWLDDYSVYKGATFNLAHNLKQMLHLRPRNRFEDLDSVYLVGGGTHPGSGLPVIYESARITTRLLLDDHEIDSSFLEIDHAEPPTTAGVTVP